MTNKQKNKQIICEAFGLTELAYCKIIMDAGYEWMHFYFINDATLIDATSKCGMFWNWWKNQWEIRDTAYLKYAPIEELELPLTGNVRRAAIEIYIDYHEPTKLKILPNVWVRNEIKKVLTEEIKKERNKINIAIHE
ncbi:MAG TPA: hypothetical protein VN698_09650 [Bacteroidia bacterium]|nr:hypothetical protein [Bacteroidia bacterium]